MSDESKHNCPECDQVMDKQISSTNISIKSGSSANHRESEHNKKVKDYDRAVKMRKKAFGSDAVGNPKDVNDPKHIIKGRTLGGQEKEVDKGEFIKAAAKDPYTVEQCKKILNRQEK